MNGCLAGMALWVVVAVANAGEQTISVPNDRYAQYALIQKSGDTQERLIVVRRTSMSGVVYSRRAYDCEDDTVHFLGSGLTLEALETDQIEWRVQSVERGTVADDLERIACN